MADVRAKQETEGTVAEGSAVAGNPVQIGLDDGANVVRAQANAAGELKSVLSSEQVDDDPFTLASSKVSVAGAIRDDHPTSLAAAEGDAVPLRVDNEGRLQVHSELFDPGTIDSFGHLITGEYSNQIDIQFFRDTPANLTTVTTAGGGATSQVGGSGKWETSTAGTANAKSVTTQNTSYRSGSEVFSLFTAFFTTGVANSFQRIGLYDDNDGMFIGFEGTSFGVTIRKAASDTTVAKASFSEDTLTGAVGSHFTRDGVPEAIDLTKFNVYRIRYGWLGSAPIEFEILAPDGHWLTFHQIMQPNNAITPSIENPDLPMTLHVDKAGADATNIIMQSNCWGAGVTAGALPLNEALTDDVLAKVARTVLVGKTSGGAYVNVQTTTAGALKSALEEYDGVPVGGGVESGSLRVTLANDSTGILTVDNAGTFAVQADSVIPGVGATNLGKAESAAHSDGDVGVMALAVRNDDLADLGGADGDYSPLQVSQNGALLVAPGANDDYKYAKIDAAGSGDNTIVALVASRKLRVVSLFMISAGTVLARFESNAAGTALTGQMSLIANSGFSLGFNPAGWFETTAGQLLNLELSAAISVDGSLTYIEVP